MSDLDKKIQSSIRLIKALDGLEPELAYSGGKDSDVIFTLAQMSGIKFHPIYKMTTIDPPGTIAHVKAKGVEIRKTKQTFFQLVEKKGFPSRFARFCCSELKEYKILDKAILGIRRNESKARSERYQDPSMCRVYRKNESSELFFPILEWSDQDVKDFVNHYGVQCHPLYYDEHGKFNVKKRLGCMCCPLQHDRGKGDFLAYPKFVRLWIKAGSVWWNEHENLKSKSKFQDIYELFAFRTFFDSLDKFCLNKEALFETDWKAALEDYFKIELP